MIKVISLNCWNFNGLALSMMTNGVFIGRRATGLVQNGMVAAVVRRDFPQIKRGKSCSQF
jgi:hypothetical protein